MHMMIGITIGGKTATTSGNDDGKIVIDSGTTFTYVSPSFYSELESLMKEAIGGEASIDPNPPQPLNLCYSSYESIKQLPQFVVHFQGADVSLNPQNFLIIVNKLLCFAVIPQDGVSIYGNIAQFNFKVEYDIDAKKMSFAQADCTKE